jgi:hypothetical protein
MLDKRLCRLSSLPSDIVSRAEAASMEDDLASRAKRDIDKLIERLTPEDRQSIRKMAESDLYRLHHGYGTWLRNQFRAGQFPDLFRFCHQDIAREHLSFDAISSVAIRELWRCLRSGGGE